MHMGETPLSLNKHQIAKSGRQRIADSAHTNNRCVSVISLFYLDSILTDVGTEHYNRRNVFFNGLTSRYLHSERAAFSQTTFDKYSTIAIGTYLCKTI